MKGSRSPFRATCRPESAKTGVARGPSAIVATIGAVVSALLVVVVVVLGGASCGGPQVVIVLKAAEDLPASPLHIKVDIGDGKSDPIETGPFSTDAIPESIFDKIPPETPIFIDVIGCKDDDPKNCKEPETFTARGCTNSFVTVHRDETGQKVVIKMHRADVVEQTCPPTLPP